MGDPLEIHVERSLGRGGMGQVFLARLLRGGREERVALKRIRPDLLDQPGAREQFEREAQLSSELDHPNIVSVIAWGVDAEGPYLALELVDGTSAAALVRASRAARRPLPLGVALSLARDCACALAHAHARVPPIVHRDVSPDNLLVSLDGVGKLADFGIAKALGSTVTRTGMIKGKFGFLAPEIYEGASAEAASDVFSFGVCLYLLLCGTTPFHGKSEAELMRSVLAGAPAPPTTLRAELPAALEALTLTCLRTRPSDRPRMAEVLASLEAEIGANASSFRRAVAKEVAAAGEQTGADAEPTHVEHSAGTAALPRRPAAHPRRWIRAGAAAVALALATTAALWWVSSRPPLQVAPNPVAPPVPPVASASPAVDARDAGVTGEVDEPPTPTIAASHPVSPSRPDPTRSTRSHRRTAASASTEARREKAEASSRLIVKVKPWGHVFVDGLAVGTSPLEPLELPPGRHAILVANPQALAPSSAEVNLEPGEERVVKFVLDVR